jgi:hypothetical protein
MFCVLGALVATAVLRMIFIRTGVAPTLPAPVFVYLAIVVAFSLGGWLLWVG